MDDTRFSSRRNKLRAVGARLGIGAAWGALPLAGAAAAGADGNTNLAIALALVVVIASLVVPLAPFLPYLHRLPIVGSPRLDVVLRLNGRKDQTITVQAGEEYTCILEVEVTNPSKWFAVKDAWIKFYIPTGIRVGRCSRLGQSEDVGQWEDFTPFSLGSHSRSDYWHDEGWKVPARLTKRIRVRLRLGASDKDWDYPILFKLSAPTLYDNVEATGAIHVRRGEPDLMDTMSKVIADGERAIPDLEATVVLPDDVRSQKATYDSFTGAANKVLTPALADDPVPKTVFDVQASDYADRAKTYLNALYVAREELGRAAD